MRLSQWKSNFNVLKKLEVIILPEFSFLVNYVVFNFINGSYIIFFKIEP